MALIFRPAREGDRDAIRQLTLAAYTEYAPRMPGHWYRYRDGILKALEKVGAADQLVAEQDGRLLGSVILYPAGTSFQTRDGATATLEFPEIRLLAVDPDVRGRGIGAGLVRACIARAHEAGARAVTLHTT